MTERKLLVAADASGKILAAYLPERQGPDTPTQVTLVGSQDEVVREVEAPEELKQAGLNAEVLLKYRLKVWADGGELVPTGHTDRY